MQVTMNIKDIWLFLIFGFNVALCYHTVYYEYQFINMLMTWPDAQQYCRLHYDDLATFTSADDIQRVKRPSNYIHAWIGLIDDPASWKKVMGNSSNSWKWSATGTSLGEFQAWEQIEPDFHSADSNCVIMRQGLWADLSCQANLYFVCFTGSLQPGSKEFILIETLSTWSEALVYCRTHHVDLAVIEDESELTTVSNLIGLIHWVWIGLSRDPFRWSDNRVSHFKNWISGEPDNKGTYEHCVVEYSGVGHPWLDASCPAAHDVICQQAVKTKTALVKMELQTGADLTNPVINAQVTDKISKIFIDLEISDIKLSWKISPEKRVMEDKTPTNC